MSTIFLLPIFVSNSWMALFKISRLLRSNERTQVNVPVVVSVPAKIKAYKTQ
uniref:Uncharacterized protein n=1 Tax=Cajanus cajan TaxID=3821 RepID=A0A151RS07_CAJCA|nr:hypothetical protein KK1_033117 [Cajanus cajan]